MTSAETELCKAIAEAEGWTCPMCGGIGKSTGRWKTSCRICRGTGYPLYLTDPSEKWRMLKALIKYHADKYGCSIEMRFFDEGSFELWGLREGGGCMYESLEHPVAEAYLAMLEEKAK